MRPIADRLRRGQPALLLGVLEAQLAYLVPAGGLDAERIAHYMLEAADGIGGQPARALLAGRLGWLVPTRSEARRRGENAG